MGLDLVVAQVEEVVPEVAARRPAPVVPEVGVGLEVDLEAAEGQEGAARGLALEARAAELERAAVAED